MYKLVGRLIFRQAIKYVVLSAAFTRLLFAQDVLPGKVHLVKDTDASVRIKNLDGLFPGARDESKTAKDCIDIRNISNVLSLMPPQAVKTEEKAVQSLISSFRNNIKFGFWDKYAVVYFSPSVFIRPFDFISIYGNHRTSYFIPLKEVKQEMESLCIQGAAVLAVDNAFKFLLGSDGLAAAVTNFALKTAVLGLVKRALGGKRNSEVNRDDSFYYSVSIRF